MGVDISAVGVVVVKLAVVSVVLVVIISAAAGITVVRFHEV